MPTPTRNRHGPRAPTLIAVILLVSVMLLALVPSSALAAGPPDGAGSGGNGPGHGGPNRDVDVDMEPKRARIRSTVSGSDGGSQGGDALEYEIQTTNRLTVQMQYRNQAEAQVADLEMTVRFRQMVEYEDTDGDGHLGPGDEVVSSYELEKAQWADLTHGEETGEDGRKVHTITARTADGVFAMVSHTAEARTMTQHGEISPNLMKIDLVVEDFPWTRTTTRLALQASVETGGPVTHVTDPAQRQYMVENEAGIETVEDDQVGFYTWVRSADVDGKTEQVRARVSNDAGGTSLTFNYAQGDSIVHDPKLGVPVLEEALFDVMERLLPYIAALVLGVVVVVIAVYARRRSDSD